MAIRLVNRGTERRTRWCAWLDSLIGRALFVILRDSVMSRKRTCSQGRGLCRYQASDHDDDECKDKYK